MKIINTQNYKVGEMDYEVKKSLIAILFSTPEINWLQLRERNKIADKIEKSNESVELEDAEHAVLVECLKSIKTLSRGDSELVERILA